MLRITVHDKPQIVTFQIEGRLAGPWLREFEECWQNTLAQQPKPVLRVDLTGVTFVDDAGSACLAAMYCQGAELVAADCLTRDIVAEITQGRPEKADPSPSDQRKDGTR
jgi:anti-anti-sigma regulatory factor